MTPCLAPAPALCVIAALSTLAQEHPQFAEFLNECEEEIRFQAARTPQSDRENILYALRIGCHTMAEIGEETRIPYLELRALLARLAAEGLIETRTERTGGAHRPRLLFFLK